MRGIFIFCLGILLFTGLSVTAQVNLVPNPGFEDTTACPSVTGGVGFSTTYSYFPYVKSWVNPMNNGTPDYFNACSSYMGVPSNFYGYQPAHGGNAYAGFWAEIDSFAYSSGTAVPFMENIQCKLNDTLVAGKKYAVSFYASLSSVRYYAGNIVIGINKLGAHFSDTEVYANTGYSLNLSSDVLDTNTYASDTVGWVLIHGYYRASGGEHWLTIGNFNNSVPMKYVVVSSGTHQKVSYVYIDDVNVSLADSVMIDTVLCSSTYPIMLHGDPLTGRYTWSTGDTTANISVSDTGTYWRRVLKDSLYYDDTFRVIYPQSTGLDTTLCVNSFPLTLHGTHSPRGVNYLWNTGALTESLSISDTGVYWRHTLGFSCIDYTDTIKVRRLENTGIDTFICNKVFPLSISGVGTGTHYTWSNGDTTASISILDTGIYWRRTTKAPCTDYTDTIHVLWPQFTGFDTVFCMSSSSRVLTSRVVRGARYLWSTGATTSSISVAGSGVFWRHTYGVSCVDFTDTFDVRGAKTSGIDTSMCNAVFPVTITGNGVGNSYRWNTGDTTANISITGGGTYWRRTIVPPCVDYTDTLRVVVPRNTGGDTMMCIPSFPTTISASGVVSGASYHWNTGATTASINATTPGKYWRITAASSCVYYTDTIKLNYLKIAGSVRTVCNPTFPLQIKGDSIIGNYHWNTGATTASIAIDSIGTYWRRTIDTPCVDYTDTIKVRVTPKPYIGKDSTYCFGTKVTLSADKSYDSYSWNNGKKTSSITVTDSGLYILTISDACGSKSDSVNVNFYPKVLPPVVQDITICKDSTSPVLNVTGNNLKWYGSTVNGSTTQPVISTSDTGMQTIEVSQSLNNCESDKAQINIHIISTPDIELGNDTTLCTEDRIRIGQPSDHTTYMWSTGDTSCCIIPQVSALYILSATNMCGTVSDSVHIDFAHCQHCVWVPTAFTPNGDGKNDILTAKPLCPLKRFTMKIYDRWGELIFISKDINYGWDGIYMGTPADVGTYYYYIDFTPNLPNIKEQVIKGSVLLIR